MKARMMSARCCCGSGPVPGCDPITGAQDSFLSLDTVKWTFANNLGATVSINPAGTLSFVSGSTLQPFFQATRCAVYDTQWDLPASLTRADNARWQLTGSWTLKPGWIVINQQWEGPGVFARFPGTTDKLYSLHRGIGWTSGIGWRHRVWFREPGLAEPFVVDLPTVIQVAFDPYPTGPFSADVDLDLERLRIGANAGNWVANAWIDGTTVFSQRPIVTPSTIEVNWDHGFATPLPSAVDTLAIESWMYLA